MPDPIIRVTIERVVFTPDGRAAGTGQGTFSAGVRTGAGRTTLGNAAQVFDYRANPNIQLNWAADVNVRNQDSATFTLTASDSALTVLANFTYRLNRPWREFEHEVLSTDNMHVVWSVQQTVRGGRGSRPPAASSAREYHGSVRYTTVSGRREFRLEICPVRPVPADARLPRRPFNIIFAELVGPGHAVRNGAARVVGASDPINVLPNPPIIPRLGAPPVAAPATPPTPTELDYANTANTRNAARIEYSYYFPDTERFTDNDQRLEWRKTGGTGNVAFLPRSSTAPRGSENKGLKVLVYGTADGDVELSVYFRNAVVAKYRAMVAQVTKLPCRFNILNGPRGPAGDRFRSTPISTPDHVAAHREIANRFLYQVGVVLVADTNNSIVNTGGRTVTRTTHAGIFRVRARERDTRNVTDARAEAATAINYRRNVLNFAYVHSHADAGTAGAAMYWPQSKLGNRATAALSDNGSPSSSWIRPSGVSPDNAAGTVNIKIIDGWAPPASRRDLHSMIVTNAAGPNPGGADAMQYGRVITHEVGHMLNLGHRVEQITNAGMRAQWNSGTLNPAPGGTIAGLAQGGGNLGANDGLWCDELWHPRVQNVMHWAGSPYLAQDLDRLQARAVLQSPLLDLAVP